MSANDGLKCPEDFDDFMGLVDRWHRARSGVPKLGEGIGDVLLRTSHELDDAVAMLRQVWGNARRYQWLRDTGYWYSAPNGSPWAVIGTEHGTAAPACGSELDAAVDAGIDDTDSVAPAWRERVEALNAQKNAAASIPSPQGEKDGGGVDGDATCGGPKQCAAICDQHPACALRAAGVFRPAHTNGE